MFVVVEGIDGAGKDTQIDLLRKETQFSYFKHPTKTFPTMRDYLDGKLHLEPKALFLLFLSDIANEQEKIANTRQLTVVDRYVFSTIAYEIEGISYYEAKSIVESVGYHPPDRVVLFDISAEEASGRKKSQKKPDRYEGNPGYLERVRERFLQLAEDKFLTPDWHIIDASRGIDEVQKDFLKALKPR